MSDRLVPMTREECIAQMQRLEKRLRSAELLIAECADALAEYEDTHDGDGGRPIANRAMQARTSIEEWRSYR